MNERKYEVLLASVIAARATSFIFSKMLLLSMSRFNLLAVRFLLAFILLSLIFCKRLKRMTRETFFAGVIMGTLYFIVMALELTALRVADSSLISLLENTAIIIVPILEAVILRALPKKLEIICAIIAMTGVLCLSAQHGFMSCGVVLGLLAALFYSFAIVATGSLAHRTNDSLCSGIIQVGTLGVFSLIASLFTEEFIFPTGAREWGMLLMLAIVCTGFGYTLQPVAQSHVSVERTGLFCSINPAIATLLGVLVLHEKIGILGIVGLVLIIFSIALPYIRIKKSA